MKPAELDLYGRRVRDLRIKMDDKQRNMYTEQCRCYCKLLRVTHYSNNSDYSAELLRDSDKRVTWEVIHHAAGAGSWSIVSGGTGTFSNGASGSSTFTATAYGTYILRWTISNGTCTPSSADVTVNYYESPTTATIATTPLNYCGTLTSGSLGGNTPSAGAGSWSIVSGGAGTFSNGASGSSTFTANAYGTYVLRWTISNGTCTSSSADVTVNYYESPTTATIATTPLNYCGTLTSGSLGGNTPSAGDRLLEHRKRRNRNVQQWSQRELDLYSHRVRDLHITMDDKQWHMYTEQCRCYCKLL